MPPDQLAQWPQRSKVLALPPLRAHSSDRQLILFGTRRLADLRMGFPKRGIPISDKSNSPYQFSEVPTAFKSVVEFRS